MKNEKAPGLARGSSRYGSFSNKKFETSWRLMTLDERKEALRKVPLHIDEGNVETFSKTEFPQMPSGIKKQLMAQGIENTSILYRR